MAAETEIAVGRRQAKSLNARSAEQVMHEVFIL
jgi:hypothetical protein